MRVHVCLRSTLDWGDRRLVEERLLPRFRPKYDAWNAAFDVPYHLFRHRVCEIARLNRSRVEGAECSSTSEVGPGQIIVPIDDDDWLAPDLANRLRRAHEPPVGCYLWSSEVIELPRGIRGALRRIARLLGRPDRHLCKTNNYAVASEPHLVPLAMSHLVASDYCVARLSDVRRVPGTLAVQNRTLASQTALAWGRPSIGREELIALLRRYQKLYRSWTLRPELAWASPYVGMMAELMQDIHPA